MHNSPNGNELQLQEFAHYLIRNRLAREEHSRFFVFWFRKFLSLEPADPKLTLFERLDLFLQGLQKQLSGTSLLMAQLMYGGGLRVMECCRLRVKDIDFDQRFLIVREGKGNKDRTTLLMVYTHVVRDLRTPAISPLDAL